MSVRLDFCKLVQKKTAVELIPTLWRDLKGLVRIFNDG